MDGKKGEGYHSGPLQTFLSREEGVGLLSDWREWASTNLAPGGKIGGSWPPNVESMGATV